MSQFYASIQGSRGQATRQGTKNSGMDGHIRGRHVGCRACMSYNEETKQDEVTIYLTSGSTGHKQSKFLGTFTTKDLD